MRSFVGLTLAAVSQATALGWSWDNSIENDEGDTTQEVSLNFDLGASYDFPMGWDKAGNFYFDTTASTYLGGAHWVEYDSPYFYFSGSAWTYVFWWDVFYNELSVEWENYGVCDSMWSIAQIGKLYVDFEVGVWTCNSTVYDYFVALAPVNHTCELTYYSFDNIVNYNDRTWQWALWPNTCNYEEPAWVYFQEPNGPSADEAHRQEEEASVDDTLESETTTTDETEAAF